MAWERILETSKKRVYKETIDMEVSTNTADLDISDAASVGFATHYTGSPAGANALAFSAHPHFDGSTPASRDPLYMTENGQGGQAASLVVTGDSRMWGCLIFNASTYPGAHLKPYAAGVRAEYTTGGAGAGTLTVYVIVDRA